MKRKRSTASTGHGTGVLQRAELGTSLARASVMMQRKKVRRARRRLERHRGTDADHLMEKARMLEEGS